MLHLVSGERQLLARKADLATGPVEVRINSVSLDLIIALLSGDACKPSSYSAMMLYLEQSVEHKGRIPEFDCREA